jgi:heme/copper-type cytochrome/quinol oxidase subunit 2
MPGNEMAHSIILLYSEVLIIGFLIWLVVIGFIVFILYKFNINSGYWIKHRNKSNYKTFYYSQQMESFLDVFFVIIPTLIVAAILVLSLSFLYRNEFSLDTSRTDFSIDVIGHQWYWSYKYSITPIQNLLYDLTENWESHVIYAHTKYDPVMAALSVLDITDDLLRTTPVEECGWKYNPSKLWKGAFNSTDLVPLEMKHTVMYQYMCGLEGYQEFEEYMMDNQSDVEENISVAFDSILDPEGQIRLLTVDNNLVIPSHTYINVCITSVDVIHSWSVPQLGIKMDAVPGRINNVILSAMEGIYYGQCSELCGIRHGFMPIVVESISYEMFMEWYFLQINYTPWTLWFTFANEIFSKLDSTTFEYDEKFGWPEEWRLEILLDEFRAYFEDWNKEHPGRCLACEIEDDDPVRGYYQPIWQDPVTGKVWIHAELLNLDDLKGFAKELFDVSAEDIVEELSKIPWVPPTFLDVNKVQRALDTFDEKTVDTIAEGMRHVYGDIAVQRGTQLHAKEGEYAVEVQLRAVTDLVLRILFANEAREWAKADAATDRFFLNDDWF